MTYYSGDRIPVNQTFTVDGNLLTSDIDFRPLVNLQYPYDVSINLSRVPATSLHKQSNWNDRTGGDIIIDEVIIGHPIGKSQVALKGIFADSSAGTKTANIYIDGAEVLPQNQVTDVTVSYVTSDDGTIVTHYDVGDTDWVIYFSHPYRYAVIQFEFKAPWLEGNRLYPELDMNGASFFTNSSYATVFLRNYSKFYTHICQSNGGESKSFDVPVDSEGAELPYSNDTQFTMRYTARYRMVNAMHPDMCFSTKYEYMPNWLNNNCLLTSDGCKKGAFHIKVATENIKWSIWDSVNNRYDIGKFPIITDATTTTDHAIAPNYFRYTSSGPYHVLNPYAYTFASSDTSKFTVTEAFSDYNDITGGYLSITKNSSYTLPTSPVTEYVVVTRTETGVSGPQTITYKLPVILCGSSTFAYVTINPGGTSGFNSSVYTPETGDLDLYAYYLNYIEAAGRLLPAIVLSFGVVSDVADTITDITWTTVDAEYNTSKYTLQQHSATADYMSMLEYRYRHESMEGEFKPGKKITYGNNTRPVGLRIYQNDAVGKTTNDRDVSINVSYKLNGVDKIETVSVIHLKHHA
jgi:hypothetical protein